MSLILDEKYLGIVSSKLLRFKKIGRSSWNFRCPICLDSQKSESKARGYIYEKYGKLFYCCHNCGEFKPFASLLEILDMFVYKEYLVEKFCDHTKKTPAGSPQTEMKFEQPFPTSLKFNINLDSIRDLPKQHYARTYIENRQIPVQFQAMLYYAPDFKKFCQEVDPDKAKNLKSDPRIIIPFYTSSNELFAVQGRALEADSKVRYITVKRPEFKDSLLVYGMERVNRDSLTYIVEGPIDSFFLPNCVAAAGSELLKMSKLFNDRVFIFDNEPKNKEICKKMAFAISRKNKVVIWPERIKEKDVNDMVRAGHHIQTVIDKHTYQGLEAEGKFAFWRKA